jgi:hypothetical protein
VGTTFRAPTITVVNGTVVVHGIATDSPAFVGFWSCDNHETEFQVGVAVLNTQDVIAGTGAAACGDLFRVMCARSIERTALLRLRRSSSIRALRDAADRTLNGSTALQLVPCMTMSRFTEMMKSIGKYTDETWTLVYVGCSNGTVQ